ncbi:MAG TPA: formate dehydrogenase accessory sulfurtransferase FdhD [Thermoanaerobaculia bacterium]|nr:formate dehydrogenase accessory sulfurtransferase FdhD [Thermoanaerobaculia bacterium]
MEPVDRIRVRARDGASDVEREDVLAVEEPLEIRVRGHEGPATSFVTTMRTPGNDEELAAGLLFAEGVLGEPRDLVSIDRPSDPRIDPDLVANVLIATLGGDAAARAAGLQRGTVMGSACGVCGKTSIENVIPSDRPPLASSLRVAPELLYRLPALLRERQSVFARTGGLHAAGLFTAQGELLEVREDIGRHNATDKIVGAAFLARRLPLADRILLVSGRAGFEIVQKAFAAGIPFIASVSAPSSLAAALAESAGVTLVGFLRERRFNVYSSRERVLRDTPPELQDRVNGA